MNPYNSAAFGFSQAYQAQMSAANAQRRASRSSDTAFANMAADEETSLSGEPTPPVAPNTSLDGMSETDIGQNTDSDLNLLARAKRRASRYLQTQD